MGAGDDLLVQTVSNGGPVSITGIWKVPPTGGNAELVTGTAAATRLGKTRSRALHHARRFLVSPNGKKLATNPGGRLWIGALNGSHGTFLTGTDSDVQQLQWLSDGSGVVYVAWHKERGHYVNSLVAVQLSNSKRQVLVKPNEEGIELDRRWS